MTVTAANLHDMKACFTTLDNTIAPRPEPGPYHRQHLCLDRGYDYPDIEAGVRQRGYQPHIRSRGEEAANCQAQRRHPARRWVVERTASWHNRFRKLLIRWEKKAENYLALVHLACCFIIYRLTVLG